MSYVFEQETQAGEDASPTVMSLNPREFKNWLTKERENARRARLDQRMSERWRRRSGITEAIEPKLSVSERRAGIRRITLYIEKRVRETGGPSPCPLPARARRLRYRRAGRPRYGRAGRPRYGRRSVPCPNGGNL